jgi:ElaB/YqjD/DUF883 family membrane-anchored ribosome-binding protein
MDQDQDTAEAADPAALAFEALKGEVAALRRQIAALSKAPAPDYSMTLGAMLEQLRLVQAHPALAVTPETYAAQARQVAQVLKAEFEPLLQINRTALREAVGLVTNAAGRVQDGQELLTRLGLTLAVGAGIGLILGAWIAVFAMRRLGL